MRIGIISSLLAALAAALLVGCNSHEGAVSHLPTMPQKQSSQTPQRAQNPSDNARRVTAEELHKLWEKNEVLIIDTRAELDYKREHIKGSISMPTGTVLSRLNELPRNKMIVAYCT